MTLPARLCAGCNQACLAAKFAGNLMMSRWAHGQIGRTKERKKPAASPAKAAHYFVEFEAEDVESLG